MELEKDYFEGNKLFCNYCKEWKEPRTRVVNENTDGDGNRGTPVEYQECPYCGYDHADIDQNILYTCDGCHKEFAVGSLRY